MCGLVGWSWLPVAQPPAGVLEAMAASLRHRGPDDEGVFRAPAAGIALAHRRLSIIDLSQGSHQPMLDAASGVALVFNGEIYNFQALRRSLQAAGVSLRSSGDTEVLLQGYLQWGIDCLHRLAGMFAIAIWDPRSGELHLARDAMGMKPLYLCAQAGGVAFASELKAFRHLPGFVGRPDPDSLQQYLEFGYVFEAGRTMLAGVSRLAPGEHLILREGRIVARRAWFVPPDPEPAELRSHAQRTEALRELLEQVVAEHLIADVPVGLLLSGGLDSSLLAALAARRGPLTTISMGFARSAVDERAHARRVAEHIGSDHHEVLITPEEIRSEILSGAWVFDDLFADWGTISTRLLYRRCRTMGIKVVLVGEGADELFGGYDRFRVPHHLGRLGLFQLYRAYAGRRHGRLFGAFRRLMEPWQEQTGDAFHAVQRFESRCQLPGNYVMKVDKASMAESVEARAPYLDRRVAAAAFRTPRRDLLVEEGGRWEHKRLLRSVSASGDLVPVEIRERTKFGAPLAGSWMDEDPSFRAFAADTILAAGSLSGDLGLAPVMEAYFRRGRSGQPWPLPISVASHLAWRLLLLELWAPHYLGSAPTAAQGAA